MSRVFALPRLVFGPRDRGRGHDLLAQSPGAELDATALSTLRDFNLRIGDYVLEGEPVWAFFELREGLWAATASVRHAPEGGNTVWSTSVVLATEPVLEATADVFALFAPFAGDEPPAAGAALEPWRVEAGAAAGGKPTALAASLRKLGWPLAVEVAQPHTVGGVLRELARTFAQWERRRVSFVSAPAPFRPWSLIVYGGEAWQAADSLAARYRVARVDGRGLEVVDSAAAGADPAWRDLLDGLERAASGEIASRMDQAVGALGANGGGAAAIERRVQAWVAGQGSFAEQRAALFTLFKAAVTIVDRTTRAAVTAGLYGAFERIVLAAPNPADWIAAYFEILRVVTRHEPPPRFLLTRLVVQSNAWFALDRQTAEKTVPDLLEGAADALPAMLARQTKPSPEHDRLLLEGALARLGPEAPASLWRLAGLLATRLAGERDKDAVALVDAVLAAAERAKAFWLIPAVVSRKRLPAFTRALGARGLAARLTAPQKAALAAVGARRARSLDRDTLLGALALHRAGNALRSARP